MQVSCGLLMYVREVSGVVVLLAHPGGPYWRNKDDGAWSIPKGMKNTDEDALDAAQREFTEETGLVARGPFIPLTPLKQKSGKLVRCWAFEGERQELALIGRSTFELEWPPRSGKRETFPEIDRAAFFSPEEALVKILPGQAGFVRELMTLLN